MASLLLRAGALALTLSACIDARLDPPTVQGTTAPDENGTVVVAPVPPEASGLRALTATADGTATTVFASEAAVDIIVDSVNAEGDYYFDVTALVTPPDSPTDLEFLSNDGPACRGFHIGAAGHIDRVDPAFDANGARCDHAVSGDAATGLALALNFDASSGSIVERDDNGNRVYRLRVARVGNNLLDEAADTRLFYVTPPAPVCGNGIVEDGEQCDDGNITDGDGCSCECVNENANPNGAPH